MMESGKSDRYETGRGVPLFMGIESGVPGAGDQRMQYEITAPGGDIAPPAEQHEELERLEAPQRETRPGIRRIPPGVVRAETELFVYDNEANDDIDSYALGMLVMEAPALAAMDRPPNRYYRPDPRADYRDDFSAYRIDRGQYVAAVREMRANPFTRRGVAVAAEARAAYDGFKGAIEDVIEDDMYGAGTTAPLLGEGAYSQVYRVDVAGKPYAVHDMRTGRMHVGGMPIDLAEWYGSEQVYKAVATMQKALPLAIGKGIDDVAQLVAYSPPDGRCVSEFIPGKTLQHMEANDVAQVEPWHIERYGKALLALAERNLIVDPNVGNVLWHPDNGLPIVDYHRSKTVPPDNHARAIETLVRGLLVRPSSHENDWVIASPRKVAEARRLMPFLTEYAHDVFGVAAPQDVNDLNALADRRRRQGLGSFF